MAAGLRMWEFRGAGGSFMQPRDPATSQLWLYLLLGKKREVFVSLHNGF